nr:hypothetical protein CFP56_19136 [Quercus suber]
MTLSPPKIGNNLGYDEIMCGGQHWRAVDVEIISGVLWLVGTMALVDRDWDCGGGVCGWVWAVVVMAVGVEVVGGGGNDNGCGREESSASSLGICFSVLRSIGEGSSAPSIGMMLDMLELLRKSFLLPFRRIILDTFWKNLLLPSLGILCLRCLKR